MSSENNRQWKVECPSEWTEVYTTEDIDNIKKIIDWLNEDLPAGYSDYRNMSKLSRMTQLSHSVVNNVLKGIYPSPVKKHIDKILQVISNEKVRDQQGVRERLAKNIDTTVTLAVRSACHRVHIYGDMGVVSGKPGTGKTEGVKRYANEHKDVILICASVNMNESTLLQAIVEGAKAEVITATKYSSGTKGDKYTAIIRKLKNTKRLIIIDEADLMSPSCIEQLRLINEHTSVGVVLVGEPRLDSMISNREGRFSRVESRVGYWTPVIKSITPEDSHALTRASLEGYEVTDEILNAFWQCCNGSARTLSKLIPNIRDFGLSQGHELTPALIFSVAQDTLRIKPGETNDQLQR